MTSLMPFTAIDEESKIKNISKVIIPNDLVKDCKSLIGTLRKESKNQIS